MIRNEDYEAEEGRAGQRVNMTEMKSGLLRQATKTEEEQVKDKRIPTYVNHLFIESLFQEAIMEAFTDKAIRKGFIKKVYCILTIQLAITVGIIVFSFTISISVQCYY